MHCFYGVIKSSTVRTIVYDDMSEFPDRPSDLVMGDGDGTVNLSSLRMCGSFGDKQKSAVHVNEVSGVEHSDILSDVSVMGKIGQLL